MIYLLDTHAVLWWFEDPTLLTSQAQSIIEEPDNIILISSVVTWEIVIKKSLGKLQVPDRIFSLIKNGPFSELPVTIKHTEVLGDLPDYHSGPFDRLLIAQARAEDVPLLTRDPMINKYHLECIEV